MQPGLPKCLSAAFVACILLLAPAQAQVNLFTQGQGLSPEDNRLLFESVRHHIVVAGRLSGLDRRLIWCRTPRADGKSRPTGRMTRL